MKHLIKITCPSIIRIVILGSILWAAGFAISMVAFAFVPIPMIGWIVLPVMLPVTIYASYVVVRSPSSKANSLAIGFFTGGIWTAIAIALDYVVIVRAFKDVNYYGIDVLLYYSLTFAIPLAIALLLQFRRKIDLQERSVN